MPASVNPFLIAQLNPILYSYERKTQEKPIIVRRVPSAYFYPFSLWPLPKYPADGSEDYEGYHTRSIKYVQVKKNKR
ncbi:unnamed protein product [Pieris brassicae]|uniref:Uncharacterized protein n=1 Tax=Pieris brassicae TaxID=7116 RepID=A0A9P0T7C8_PIEBR|nr:unnamed protein product [Pieris brassicae]